MQPAGSHHHASSSSAGFSWFPVAALFAFLTFNSGLAVYHAKGDDTIVAFVSTSYIQILLLFGSLWFYERAAPGSPRRNMLKASVWALTTLLTFSFAYMVMGTAGLALPLALLVWTIAAATGIGAFRTFFEHSRINHITNTGMLLPISNRRR